MPRKNLLLFLCVLFLTAMGISRAFSDERYYKQMRTFSKILNTVLDQYVEEVKPDQLFEGAYRGMLQTLDPYSQYFTEEESESFAADTKGQFGGIGIEISMNEGILTVISPIRGTPAYEAGVLPGDMILKVDGKSTERITSMEAVRMLRGQPGTRVLVTIRHRGSVTDNEITLIREIIKPVVVEYEILDENVGIGFMRVSSFSAKVISDMKKAVEEMQRSQELRGLILDLRQNPGGLLEMAVAMCDEFIADGVIVSIKGRHPEQDKVFKASPDPKNLLETLPLVVLVDEGSASASEIVAGCIRDHKRGLLIGDRTYGKGSVQNVFPLSDGQAMKLTTAHYYTPANKPIKNREGIMPDIYMPITRDQLIALRSQEREDKLRSHYSLKGLIEEETETTDETRRGRVTDYQLKAALEIVKTLVVKKEMTATN